MDWINYLLNAQVSVIRAVFEANAPGRYKGGKPRLDYVMTCITDAIEELTSAKERLEKEINS